MSVMLNDKNLIWIDLEMTGLDTQTDTIIEIATIVTDPHLNVLGEGPVCAIYTEESILELMDPWNRSTHTKSGLVDRIRHEGISLADAQQKTIDFLRTFVPSGKSPMCGNSICQDRRFLHRQMPELEAFFHYRNLDVSTVKELALRWAPQIYKGVKKDSRHIALDDIKDAIEELRHYRQYFFNVSQ